MIIHFYIQSWNFSNRKSKSPRNDNENLIRKLGWGFSSPFDQENLIENLINIWVQSLLHWLFSNSWLSSKSLPFCGGFSCYSVHMPFGLLVWAFSRSETVQRHIQNFCKWVLSFSISFSRIDHWALISWLCWLNFFFGSIAVIILGLYVLFFFSL